LGNFVESKHWSN